MWRRAGHDAVVRIMKLKDLTYFYPYYMMNTKLL